MTAYRDEREALIHQVRLLEQALGKERAEREAAAEERERLTEEVASLRRLLPSVPHRRTDLSLPTRWAPLVAVIGMAAMASIYVGGRARCPTWSAHTGDTLQPLDAALPSLSAVPVPPPWPPVGLSTEPLVDPPRPEFTREEPLPSEVQEVLSAARDRMRSCPYTRTGRRASVRIVFSGETGGVLAASVLPSSMLDARAERCIVRELEKARVAPFARDSVTVSFPVAF